MSFNIGSWKLDHLSLFRFVYQSFQLLGYFPSSVQSSDWKSRLHKYYKLFNISLCYITTLSHFLSTIVHSVHHLPEFFTCLLEDVTLISVFIIVVLLRYRVNRFESVIHYMETSFSTVDSRLLAECHRKSLATVIMFVVLFMMVLAGVLAEFFTPMTEDELKLREELHGIKPEAKRSLFNLWIPGIDGTEPWMYVVNCIVQVYMSILFLWSYVCVVSLMPMIMIYAEGQIKILCNYIEMLGSPHKDSEGNRIFYTQFETNSYVLVSSIVKHRSRSCKTTQEVECLERTNLRKMRTYERHYFKQLVRFHQKMLTFIEQIYNEITFIVLLMVISNYMNISFALYQLTVYNGHQSNGKLFKFLAELIMTLVQFGTYCNTIERWDECHSRMRTSLYTSRWYTCSRETCKDMWMLLIRLRKPNYPRFYQGVIVISNPMFVRFVNVCYKAVNLMKITSSRG